MIESSDVRTYELIPLLERPVYLVERVFLHSNSLGQLQLQFRQFDFGHQNVI